MTTQRRPLPAALLLLASLAAHAQTPPPPAAERAAHAAALTRAEVLADLQIWRESGLALLDVDPTQAPFSGTDYAKARERYERMRASPEFAERVSAIARRRGEVLPSQAANAVRRTVP